MAQQYTEDIWGSHFSVCFIVEIHNAKCLNWYCVSKDIHCITEIWPMNVCERECVSVCMYALTSTSAHSLSLGRVITR